MHNFTKYGYAKLKAPDALFQPLKEFWELNKDQQTVERWPIGYVNLYFVAREKFSIIKSVLGCARTEGDSIFLTDTCV